MSHTTLYRVPAKGSIEAVAEFRNSHGSAAFVWSMLCVARLGWESNEWLMRGMDSEDRVKPLWDLSEDKSLPDHERITLMTTFDHMMVRRENIPRVAAAFRAFVEAYQPERHNHVCSLLQQADELEKLAEDAGCFAVCWNQTSTADTWPWIYRDDEEGRAYDVSLDSEHEFLFDSFDEALKKEVEA